MRKVQRNALITALIAVSFAVLSVTVKPEAVLGRVVSDFNDIPIVMGEWNGYDLDTNAYASSVPDSSLLMRDYINDEARLANLTIVYGTDISEIHKPEYCFQGHGWSELSSTTTTINSPSGPSHAACLLTLRDNEGGLAVCVYWYAGNMGATDSLASQRLRVWKGALTTGKVSPSALVRILVPVTGSEDQAKQDALSLAAAVDEHVMRMVGRGKQ